MKQIPIDEQKVSEPKEYRISPISLIITAYELSEKKTPVKPGENPYEWLATVTHVFHADTVERAYQISESHKETDAFYKASFEGRFPWKGSVIILKNSEFQIIKS